MNIDKIAILGAGNMGFAIAEGIVKSGRYSPEQFLLATKSEEDAARYRELGYVVADNVELVKSAKLVFVVVKPWQIKEVLEEVAPYLTDQHILVSSVTGPTSTDIYGMIGKEIPLFRLMPNTGISVQESMSCLSESNVSEEQHNFIKELLELVGAVVFVTEAQMPAATAIAGCGIAFALRFIRAATESGVEIGFFAKDAALMAAQITKGAAELIIQNGSNPEVEIDKVTTPGGVTITGLNEMEHNGFTSAVIKGIGASYKKMI